MALSPSDWNFSSCSLIRGTAYQDIVAVQRELNWQEEDKGWTQSMGSKHVEEKSCTWSTPQQSDQLLHFHKKDKFSATLIWQVFFSFFFFFSCFVWCSLTHNVDQEKKVFFIQKPNHICIHANEIRHQCILCAWFLPHLYPCKWVFTLAVPLGCWCGWLGSKYQPTN